MIGPGTGVRVYLACGATDMREGIGGLAALAQEVLRQKPASGAVFAFRGRLSCPLLSGPSTMTVWTKEGTTNASQEARARGNHREAA